MGDPRGGQARLLRLTRGELPAATAALAEAFADYPLLVHAVPDPERRKPLARAFSAAALGYALRWGEAYASSPAMEGIAAWVPSPHFPLTAGKTLRAVPLAVLVTLGRNGGGRMRGAAAYLDALHRELAPADHLFLFVLGVRPEFRGRGHASRLLRPVLARLDREGRPCYVDTVNGDAVAMYEHFGFRVLAESRIPGTDLTAWALVRQPAPPGGGRSPGGA
ncbi:MAG TPA: N-acetyltransferase [Candidatus Acetothermia bacterium]|nr:N-acetyltransferase [Candidatus Acetothermia bacterium]